MGGSTRTPRPQATRSVLRCSHCHLDGERDTLVYYKRITQLATDPVDEGYIRIDSLRTERVTVQACKL